VSFQACYPRGGLQIEDGSPKDAESILGEFAKQWYDNTLPGHESAERFCWQEWEDNPIR